jgi:hypothetical protein
VGMHIDGLDPLSVDHDGQFLTLRLLGVRALQQTATTEDDAAGDGPACFQKITACGHEKRPPYRLFAGLV